MLFRSFLDEDELGEELGESYTDDDVRELIWGEIDKINDAQPLFKKVKKLVIRKREFDKTTGRKIKRFVDSNKEE